MYCAMSNSGEIAKLLLRFGAKFDENDYHVYNQSHGLRFDTSAKQIVQEFYYQTCSISWSLSNIGNGWCDIILPLLQRFSQ